MAHTNDQVAHAFVHSAQKHMKGSNLFYEGHTIYSYGYHFPIARGSLENGFLFTSQDYSITTTRHKSIVRRALVGTVFTVHNVLADTDAEHTANFEDYRVRYVAMVEQAARSRSFKAAHLLTAENLVKEANAYAKFFLKDNDTFLIDVSMIDLDVVKRAIKAQRKKEKKERKIQLEQLAIENAERIKQWRAGIDTYLPSDLPPMLRLGRAHGRGIVQTSWGAVFPADEACYAWRVIKAVKARGKRWAANGETITLGIYSVDWITEKGDIKAGCHLVSYEEALNCARLLGVEE